MKDIHVQIFYRQLLKCHRTIHHKSAFLPTIMKIIFTATILAFDSMASANDLESSLSAGGCGVGAYKDKSCQSICNDHASDWWGDAHGCQMEQTQDITNDRIEWDWFTCDTTAIPVDWSTVMLAEVEGKGPACACGYGKCCASTKYAETNARCFKNDGKTTCSAGSNMACCCYLLGDQDKEGNLHTAIN